MQSAQSTSIFENEQSMDVPTISLTPERRRQIMSTVGLYESVSNEMEIDWDFDFEYSDDEDLLNIEIGEKYQDAVADPNGYRLIVQDVFVEDFKSYEGAHQLGPFHKNLTMILGPNGSGKSNVIDALLFVFGYNGTKIRTKNLTSLIHKSDGNVRESCKVEIHFEWIKDVDEEKFTVMPESSFRLSRVVQRDGKNQYAINDEPTTHKEVQELLLRAGIDLKNNRFMILQGEVEAIALMKPTAKELDEGMLEYVEDLIGTNRFKVPIAKLTHRISCLEVKLTRAKAFARRIEATIDELVEPMRECVEYIDMKNELNYLSCINLHMTMQSAKDGMRRIEENIDRKKEEMEDKLEERRRAEEKQRKSVDFEQEKEAERKQIEEDLKVLERTIAKLEASMKAFQVDYKKVLRSETDCEEELKSLKEKLEKARLVPDKSAQLLEQVSAQMLTTKEQIERFDQLAIEGNQKYELVIEEHRSAREEFAEKFSVNNKKMNEMSTSLQVLRGQIQDMQDGGLEDQKRLSELKTNRDILCGSHKGNEQRYGHLKTSLDQLKKRFAELSRNLPALQAVEKDLRSRIEQHTNEKEELEEMQETPTEPPNEATRFLQKLKDEGKFPGYIGRVGDLASIDEKYAPVISNIYNFLDYHIVETNDDSQFGIEMLHENKIGRTSFNALCNMRVNQTAMNRKPYEFPAERLFDKITTTVPGIRECYYYYLKDLLVVNNLTEAQKLFQKHDGKYLVCSLDTSIITSSGAVTGGGRPGPARIRVNNRVPRQDKSGEIVRLSGVIENLTKRHNEIKDQIARETAEKDSCSLTVRDLKQEFEEVQASMARYPRSMEGLEKAISELEIGVSADPALEASIENLEKMKKEEKELQQKVDEFMDEFVRSKSRWSDMEKKLNDIFVDLVQTHKDACSDAREKYNVFEKEQAKQKVLLQNAPRQIEDLERSIADCEERWEELRREKQERGVEEKSRTVEIEELLKQAVAMRAEEEESEKRAQLALEQRLCAAEDLRVAAEAYKTVADQCHEYQSHLLMIEDNLAREEEELNDRSTSWFGVEDLDPDTLLVRHDCDELENQLAHGALIIPPEVTASVKNYAKELRETLRSTNVSTKHERSQLADAILHAEKRLKQCERDVDKKGISRYAMIHAIANSEQSILKSNSNQVAVHRQKLNELSTARLDQFTEALTFLGTTTQRIYQLITNGGDASLRFVEEGGSANPFDAGIKFNVRPSKKSWKLIENLSGGEKTLASLCFVFAMHHFRASPLYVLDEIDAALDLNNVRLVANYIKHAERTQNAQFIIVSLRNQMFEAGHRLIGVYKTSGCTHNVVIAPLQVEKGNKGLQMTLNQKIMAEEKKRKEEADAEKFLASIGKTTTSQPQKRTRKLGRLNLADFGLVDDPEEDTPPTLVRPAPPAPPTPNPFDNIDDDNDEPVKRRRRQVVEEEEDEEMSE